jgi:hypothetical protein
VTTALVVVAAVLALACPAHMLWRMRRGRSPGCVPGGDAAESLQRRQAELTERVARAREQRG